MKHFDPAVYREIFEWNQYDNYVKVEPGDRVVDLGCSVGYFYFKHKNTLSEYIGIDGSIDCLQEFQDNLEGDNKPILINSLIGRQRDVVLFQSMFHQTPFQKVQVITFDDLIRLTCCQYHRKIDFLKFDIESWETVFWESEESLKKFQQHVTKFVGEVHFMGEKNTRATMMDNLRRLQGGRTIFKLFSVDGVDITEYFWRCPEFYSEIIISGRNFPF